MLSILIFILILSSGSFLSAVLSRGKFGEILPVTCMTVTMVLFLFGIVDLLLPGVYFILVVTAFIYLFSCIWLVRCIRKKTVKTVLYDFASCFFSMGFFAFVLFVMIDFYCNTGRLVSGWDDFSHWATTVKQMVMTDCLSVNPKATFVFYKHYPPATSIFLYLFQRIMFLTEKNAEFSEWRLFFAQHILMWSFTVPFCDKLSRKKTVSYVAVFILFAAPLMWYEDAYSSLQVDCLLGIVLGSGLTAVVQDHSSTANNVFVLLSISFLVLLKSAGIILAVLLALGYIAAVSSNRKALRHLIPHILLAAVAVAVPKILWNYTMTKNGVIDDAGIAFDLTTFVNVVTGNDSSFRADVFVSFLKEILNGTAVKLCGFEISYLAFFLVSIFTLLFLGGCKRKLKRETYHVFYCTIIIAGLAVIIISSGLLLTYLFHFSKVEALGLASFHRYTGMGFNALLYLLLFQILMDLNNIQQKKVVAGILVFALAVISVPFSSVFNCLHRDTIRESYILRSGIGAMCTKAEEYAEKDDVVYFVHQGARGYSYWMSRFLLMPVRVNPLGNTAVPTWHFGETEDNLTKVISAEDWQQELKDTCDYVILFIIDEYFTEKYASVFEDPDSIFLYSIYQVDKETGKLSLLSTLDL